MRGQRYCSQKCGMAARKKHSASRWGLKGKPEEFCRNCGAPPSHLHHIVPRSKSRKGREDMELNGMALCFACHRGWHDRRVTIYHDRLTDAEFHNATQLAGSIWVERNYPDREEFALLRLDELISRRRLAPDRPEVFDERQVRIWAEIEAEADRDSHD